MEEKNRAHHWAEEAAKLAEESILTEAVLTPKPGLVDAKDSGSHKDMDIFTFLRSAVSLREGFKEMFLSGYHGGADLKELLKSLRPKGMDIEARMFEATKDINTHKGIIFSMGLLLAALGNHMSRSDYQKNQLPTFTEKDTEEVFQIIRSMTKGIIQSDFKNLNEKTLLTHGERLYKEYGFTGIRGEAEKGYPVLREKVLPVLREGGYKEQSYDSRLLDMLMILMSEVEDSNIVSRGGMESLQYVRRSADRFMKDGGMRNPTALEKLHEMNQDFVKRNLSPGGSADLLSLAVFLGKMENIL
ncbi:triphosphoribosyl-dephospho-CoA synthase CitG [Proteiniclasticum sp. SCR006]|uniref:Probable 2-(5''-triphosphoribosyl)-3'-dephosphocoenzyme-A synthase n=1 Tax=Proteiniclasticum aestuarii TaxID=2817862 RepID=A0A939H9N6_9CLOT|nr:triphosphoribosyl-dephospho-CoA synthase CitG [Proteiniclasticum aestuarii]MBO1264513.1 triphosphoribosyl-dephospho-CoA synthase CitG [Proteiniclasticum aestuarii]